MVEHDDSRAPASKAQRSARKDRLIQTRVPRDLESTLKDEARRRRLSVSHLIRNILEDTFHLVDGVVADVDQIVTDSVTLARDVGRSARRLAGSASEGSGRAAAEPDGDLSHIYAWNEVVMNQAAACSRCASAMERGERGYAGLSDEPGHPRAWLCERCIERL